MLSTLPPNLRGILAMTGASIIFVFSDALAKYAAAYWPIAQILTVRGLFAIAAGLAAVLWAGTWRSLPLIRSRLIVGRSGVEGYTALSFLCALPLMPLADLTSLLMLSPLAITAIATLFLGESVGWRRWSAIGFGFVGMLLVVQPSGAPAGAPYYYWGVALGLMAVAGVAMRDLLTRKLEPGIPGTVVTLGASIGSCTAGALLSMNESWAVFHWVPLVCCILAAVIVTAGNFLIVLACRGVDLSVVAPYRFSAVFWSILIGALAFGEVPNLISLGGMAMIVASGIYTLHRERVRARAARAERGAS